MPLDKHLHIVAANKSGSTYLSNAFYKQPFKLANITEGGPADWLRLMITSSSPGVLNNDEYNLMVELEADAKVHLTTQGYQRIFSMKNAASQHMEILMGNNASLCFLPHPSVPHAKSSFLSINNIYLSDHHHLICSEIITCGRKLSGEAFKFQRYHSLTNVFLNNKMVVRENVLLEPLSVNVHSIGQLEGYSHQSTLLFIDDSADMKELAELCYSQLSASEGISFGISAL
ncbi:MAG: urease accessory protein UreD, partial [Ginsengibacter sp.]